jgi:hypothetical protein
MGDVRGSEGRSRKTRRHACGHHCKGEELSAPKQKRHEAQSERGDDCNRQYRLVIGGEVEGNTGPKGDGNPRQQPSGPGLSAHPFAQFFECPRPGTKAGGKAAGADATVRWPGPRNALCPARRPTRSAIRLPQETRYKRNATRQCYPGR